MKGGTNSRGVFFFLIAFRIGKISYLTYRNGISYVEWYITWDINHKERLRGSEGEILAAAHSTQSAAETWKSQDDESDRQGQMTSKGGAISWLDWYKWPRNRSITSPQLSRRQSKAFFDLEQYTFNKFQST